VFNSFEEKKAWVTYNTLPKSLVKFTEVTEPTELIEELELDEFADDDYYGLIAYGLHHNILDYEDLVLLDDLV
jgi:hypothetical protein